MSGQRNSSGPETEIHVLSIRQPWADAILFGDKWCENRSWATRYRGPLYIHASMQRHELGGEGSPGNDQRGAILGRVNLVEVLDLEELGEQEARRIARSHGLSTSRAAMQHVEGTQCWIMTEPQVLKHPIETKGMLNVWKYTARQSQLKFHRDRMSAVTSLDAAAWEHPPIDAPPSIDEWSKDELMAWIRQVFNTGGPRTREEAIHELATELGYRRVGSHIREALDNALRTAVRRGILDNDQGDLSLLCRHITDYTRDHLVEMLLAAIGPGWRPQPEAIRAAAHHLGYERTGKNIQTAFQSAINAAIRRGVLERNGQDLRRIS